MPAKEQHHDERDVLTNAELTEAVASIIQRELPRIDVLEGAMVDIVEAGTKRVDGDLLTLDAMDNLASRIEALELRCDLRESPVALRIADALEKIAEELPNMRIPTEWTDNGYVVPVVNRS